MKTKTTRHPLCHSSTVVRPRGPLHTGIQLVVLLLSSFLAYANPANGTTSGQRQNTVQSQAGMEQCFSSLQQKKSTAAKQSMQKDGKTTEGQKVRTNSNVETFRYDGLKENARRNNIDIVKGRQGAQLGGIVMHNQTISDLSIGVGLPGNVSHHEGASNLQLTLEF